MRSPYRAPVQTDWSARRVVRWPVRIAVPMLLALLGVGLVAATRTLSAYAASPFPVVKPVPYRPGIEPPGTPPTDLAHEPTVPVALRPGETVAQLLGELGLPPGEAAEVIRELSRHADLRRLRPVDCFEARLDGGRTTGRFGLLLAGKGRAVVERRGDGWSSTFEPFERSVRHRVVKGRLEDSLVSAVLAAGAPGMLAYRMSDVFQWDLDFNRDLRRGDEFEALYEQIYLDGNYDSVGEIVALRYTNMGRTLEAYRFGDPPGYYDGEGRPMRKMFLRSPLRFSRVTSRFSSRRFHPVLKRYRPHYGVDYGAPAGTPVRATGGGVVVAAGWDGGGGRTVKVRHPNGYLTAYLHLSRFAPAARPGRRVAQGELIGYVGSTGLATAPHLDYRVQHQGRWIDPLSLKNVPTAPLPGDRRPEFERWRDELRHSLASGLPPATPVGRTAELSDALDPREPGAAGL